MIAWLLVITIGTTATISVPGIESEAQCEALAQRFATTVGVTPTHKCVDYRAARIVVKDPEVIMVPFAEK